MKRGLNETRNCKTSRVGFAPQAFLDYEFGSYKGYMAENFVAQELRTYGVRDLYCWQGRTSDVAFLLESLEGIIPVEVKSGHISQSKSLKVYEQRFNPPHSCIISAKNFGTHGRRRIYPLYAVGSAIESIGREVRGPLPDYCSHQSKGYPSSGIHQLLSIPFSVSSIKSHPALRKV